MTEKTYKVGDVLAWEQVPSGALVRGPWDERGFFVERGAWRYRVKGALSSVWYSERSAQAYRAANLDTLVTIIALGLTGQETAADLQRLAEVFEVREAVKKWSREEWVQMPRRGDMPGLLSDFVRDLHAAGWCPGDTAERAAELLRGAP
jgi:hypothetical protein